MRGLRLALCCALAAGCSDEARSLSLRVRIPHPPNAVRLCTNEAQLDGGDRLPLETIITQLRLTVLAPGQAGMPARFVCDRVFPVRAGNQQEMLVPDSAPLVDVILEAYSGPVPVGPFKLEYYGEARNVRNRSGGPLVNLFLVPPRDFGCTPGLMLVPRAFHSATSLPDGTVLLAGGLTQPDMTHTRFSATSKFELYDPATHSFVEVADTRPPGKQIARAFHHAFFLGTQGDGRYLILLVGGVTAASAADPVMELRGAQPLLPPLRLSPIPGVTIAAGVEVLAYDHNSRSVAPAATDGQSASFHARMFAAVPDTPVPTDPARLPNVLITGGAAGYNATGFTSDRSLQQADLTGAPVAQTGLLADDRIGASVTPVSPSQALVFGGDLKVAMGAESMHAMEVVSGIPGAPSGAVPAMPAMAPVPTAFHTATLLPDGKVLIVGGFQVIAAATGGIAADVNVSAPVQRLTVSGPSVVVEICPPALCPLRPVGYHQTTRLDDIAALLVTGGSPNASAADPPDGCTASSCACAPGQCSVGSAYLISSPATITQVSSLKVARYGHQGVQLADGNALVTGGLRRAPDVDDGVGGTIVLNAAELFNPHPRTGFDRANLLTMANRTEAAEADHGNPDFPRCLTRDEYNMLHP